MNHHQSRFYEFGEFRLDAHKRLLLKNGELVHLTHKVFEVLLVLIQNSGRVLEKDELMNQVWEGTIVEEANLKNSISTLRKALGDERGASHYIQTLPKRGYKFIAPVIALPDEDETYLVEKHTTTEIVIDTFSENPDIRLINENQQRLESDFRELPEGLSVGADGLRDSTTELVSSEIAGSQRTPQLLTGKVSFINRMRRPLVVTGLIVVLMVIAAVSIGMYRWIISSKVGPSVSFEKMKVTRLTNVGNYMAVISPDGKYIAYIMYGTPTGGLWVRQTATDSAVKLLPSVTCWGLAFSRDSNYVYYNFADEKYREGALYKISVLGGPPKLVLERLGGGVSLSPDGRRMVFKRMNKEVGKMELITANTDGSDERIILRANSRYLIHLFDWSPDGKRIAFSWVNNAVDGQSIWQMVEIPAEGGDVKPITSPQKEAILALTWLPDGSGFIITATDRDTELPQLWHLSYPGGQATRITNDSNFYLGATITADGETILTQQTTGSSNLWIADTEDFNHLRKITADGAGYDDLTWTPDGRILHSEGDNGKSNLWLMNTDGTGHRRLTDGPGRDRWPAMSSDGGFIVYVSRRSGQRQIWRMDSDGRNAKQLTDVPEGADHPRITPDNQFVLYRTERPTHGWTLIRIPADGGESVMLADKAGEFAISPDSKMVAYESFDEQKKRYVIVVKSIDGGEPIKVLDYPDFPVYQIEQWVKDGLLCIGNHSFQIILIPVDGHPPRQLTDFKTGERIFSFAQSADGRQMALSLGTSTTETLKITDFKRR
jgi:Tol biopolymer transport system component/DNA-binding winged helix-turn-helix (wHTH) protein